MVPIQYERIEHLKIILTRLLSYENSGESLPPEVLQTFFTEGFQEKYKSLSLKNFNSKSATLHSEVKRLNQITNDEWQAWIQVVQNNTPAIMSFRLRLDKYRIDQITLQQDSNKLIPTIKGSPIAVLHVRCGWSEMNLPSSPQWLKQLSDKEYLLGFEKSKLSENLITIPCGARRLSLKLEEGDAYLDESEMIENNIKPAPRRRSLSDVERKLQDSLGFTVE